MNSRELYVNINYYSKGSSVKETLLDSGFYSLRAQGCNIQIPGLLCDGSYIAGDDMLKQTQALFKKPAQPHNTRTIPSP